MYTTSHAKAFLRYANSQSALLSTPLRSIIEAMLFARVNDTKEGKVLVGGSMGGKSVSYSIPSVIGTLSQGELTQMLSDLIDLYESVNTLLISSGILIPSDAEIFAEMLNRLKPVTSFQKSFQTIRC